MIPKNPPRGRNTKISGKSIPGFATRVEHRTAKALQAKTDTFGDIFKVLPDCGRNFYATSTAAE